MVVNGFTTPTWRGEVEGMLTTIGPPMSKDRKLYRFSGLGTQIRYGVHNHSLGNVRRGLVERVFMVEDHGVLVSTPKPTPGAWLPLVRFSDLLVSLTAKTTRMTTQEFLGFYTGRRRDRYAEAIESLEMLPLKVSDSWLSTFVKAEKLNITAKPDPAPRVIQPRNPRYNVELGCYLRHAEEMVFEGINKVFGGRTIFKGINADTAGQDMAAMWATFQNPVGIGMDASRFDQHISVDALNFEHNVWLQLFPVSERGYLRRLLEMQVHNRGIARCPDGEIRYKVDGCRMSGDMNTSSGNCIIMCASVYTYCIMNRISKFRLANNGDDCMLIIESGDLGKCTKLVPYYRALGFTMKVEAPVYELEHIEFCQTRPVLVDGSYRMVRNCHHSLSKDMHSLVNLARLEDREDWVTAVGDGGRVVNEGVPVMQAFFHKFPKYPVVGKGYARKAVFESLRYKFHRQRLTNDGTVKPETRFSFWVAFGITPDEQVALEESFGNLSLELSSGEYQEAPSLLSFSKA